MEKYVSANAAAEPLSEEQIRIESCTAANQNVSAKETQCAPGVNVRRIR